ncbi:MAG TPA: hypothetical protein VHU84_09065 [Lacipirellulaceae bacterium]|nr:hypothetical protein [Lacipirellulaceae bacterium]
MTDTPFALSVRAQVVAGESVPIRDADRQPRSKLALSMVEKTRAVFLISSVLEEKRRDVIEQALD